MIRTRTGKPGRLTHAPWLARPTWTLVATTLALSACVAAGADPSAAEARAHASADSAREPAAMTERVVGYVAYWDQQRALQSVDDAGATLTELSPSWYAPAADGSIVVQERGAVDDSPATVSQLRSHGALVVPALANYRDGRWDRAVVAAILADPARRAAHVREVREFVRDTGSTASTSTTSTSRRSTVSHSQPSSRPSRPLCMPTGSCCP